MAEDTIKTIVKLMNTLVQLPNMQSRLDESLSKLITVPQDVGQFGPNFTHFLTEIYQLFFKNDEHNNSSSEFVATKLSLTCDFIDGILQYIQSNLEQFKEAFTNSKTTQIPQVFYNILYWPLSVTMNRNEVNLFYCYRFTVDAIKHFFSHLNIIYLHTLAN